MSANVRNLTMASRIDQQTTHPLSRLAMGAASTFDQAMLLIEAGIERELAEARELGDAQWLASLRRHGIRVSRARRIYREQQRQSDLATIERFRQAELGDFAQALEQANYSRLSW